MPTIAVQPQLIEAEKQLTIQEAELTQQIEDIREKRKGLQMVIAMFKSQATPALAKTAVETSSLDTTETAPKPKTIRKSAAKTTKAKRGSNATSKTKATKKTDGRAATWQRYIHDNYKGTPLHDVIDGILKSLSDSSFKIAEIISAIFTTEDMPKAQFLKVRNRISNILSVGARNGDWYRGKGGTYSASKKAVEVR